MLGTSNMSFNTFCNICFMKEHIIKLCVEENEAIFNILICFTSCPDAINGIIYLCINCCNKLEEYDKFRELFLTNFVRFRYLYNEYKKQLEILHAPDIEKKLKTFVDINVERSSGTPLIENYEAAEALRNNTGSNIVICKEPDGDFFKTDENDSGHADISFSVENNSSENKTHTCYRKCENEFFNEDQENINGSSVAKHEPNTDRFEESHDPLMSDTVANDTPCHKSEDAGIFEVSSNPENCVTDDVKGEKGLTDDENKRMTCNIVCNVCDERFSCNSDLDVHIRTHTNKKHYSCDQCNKTFTDIAELKKHKLFHSGKIPETSDEKPFSCEECHKTFSYNSHLIIHKRIHTGEKPYKCDECGMRFTCRSHLKTHKLKHTGEQPYKCDECGLRFRLRSYIKRHKRVHTGERPFSCDECPKTFIDSGKLTEHKRIHSGEKPFSCDECDKKFTRCSTLIKHKRFHSGEKPFECDECGMRFIYQCYLNAHKLKHTDEKPYKCDECSLGFGQLSHLKRHKRNHIGERPFSCDECHKTFTNNSYLIIHKRLHTGEKPYNCDECGLGFAHRSHLNTHKRVHTGEKPYKCEECGLGFTRSDSLNKHKRTHTGEKPYSCDECQKKFPYKSSLKVHKRIHIREKE